MIPLANAAIRREMLAKRMQLSEAQVKSFSQRILTRCKPYLSQHSCIGLYLPIKNEVDLTALLNDDAFREKRFAIPRVCLDHHMEFVLWQRDMELKRSPLGIWEPRAGEVIAPQALDVLLIPCAAFHPDGVRIGYGGGYYDRYLSICDAQRIAVAYEFQRCDAIIAQPHDIPMDLIISEQSIYAGVKRKK